MVKRRSTIDDEHEMTEGIPSVIIFINYIFSY
nr:MAG TPA: hypothetical protein [Caudoviricetes sp.]